MDEILEAIININTNEDWEDAEESTASFPSEDLPLDIWDKVDDTYKLKPELKETILDALSQYPDADLLDMAQSIKIVGSIGTNLYDEDADIDVHVEPKPEALEGKTPDELEQFQRDVMNWFKNEREEKGWFVDQHPMEVYFSLAPVQDYFSDTVYDLLTDEWIKPVKKYAMDYDPFTAYGDVLTELDEVAAPADILLGKIKRALDYIDRIHKGKGAEDLVQPHLQEIKDSVLALKECKENWRLIRRRNSVELPNELPDDVTTLEQPDAWKHDNNIFKLLDGSSYFAVVNSLAKLIDDNGELVEDASVQARKILSDFYSK
jgi:hypothetical protein